MMRLILWLLWILMVSSYIVPTRRTRQSKSTQIHQSQTTTSIPSDYIKPTEIDRIQAYSQLTANILQRLLSYHDLSKEVGTTAVPSTSTAHAVATTAAATAMATTATTATTTAAMATKSFSDPESPESIQALIHQLQAWSTLQHDQPQAMPRNASVFGLVRTSQTWRKTLRNTQQLQSLFHINHQHQFTQKNKHIVDTREIILTNCYQDLLQKLTDVCGPTAPTFATSEIPWKSSPSSNTASTAYYSNEILTTSDQVSLLQLDRLKQDLRHLVWAFHQELHSPTTFSSTTTKLLRKKFITSTLLSLLYQYLMKSGDLILSCMTLELYQSQPWVLPKSRLLKASVAALRKSSNHKNCHRYAVAYFHKIKPLFPINNITIYNRYQDIDAADILQLQVESLKHHIELYLVQSYDDEYLIEFTKRSEKYLPLLLANETAVDASIRKTSKEHLLIPSLQLASDIMHIANQIQLLSGYWLETDRKAMMEWLAERFLIAIQQQDLLLSSCLLHVMLKFCRGLMPSRYLKYFQELIDHYHQS